MVYERLLKAVAVACARFCKGEVVVSFFAVRSMFATGREARVRMVAIGAKAGGER